VGELDAYTITLKAGELGSLRRELAEG